MLGSHCIDEHPIYAGNANLIESILALHLRIGLGLVASKDLSLGKIRARINKK